MPIAPTPRTANTFEALSDAGSAGRAEEDGWTEVPGRPPLGQREAGPSQPRHTRPCTFWAKGYCQRGDACKFSHDGPRGKQRGTQQALAPGPSGANKARAPGPAPAGALNKDAAGHMVMTAQVDASDPRYKSAMCQHFLRGVCGRGDACSFAHSKDELRKKGRGLGARNSEDTGGRGGSSLAAFFPPEVAHHQESGGTSADGSAGEGPPDQAPSAHTQQQRNGSRENGEHATNSDAGDDALSDALGDLCLEYEDIEEDLAPESFCCPITHELMRNPVVACDGYSYERHAIQEWLEKHDTSPMTNEAMESKDLVPNRALRAVIRVLYAPK